MTNDERRELIAAVREALAPFKEELKTELKDELKDELLEPMETRLRDDLGGRLGSLENEVEHMREDFGGKLDNLEIETSSIINDVVAPFIEMADVRHRELVERLDRLEGQVQSNHKAIENVSTTADLLGRQLMDLSDDVSIVRKRLDKLERGLNNVTYDLTEARFMVNEEHSIYKAIRELEERVARLEEGKEKSEEAPSQNSGVGELKNLPQIIEWLQREGAKGKSE